MMNTLKKTLKSLFISALAWSGTFSYALAGCDVPNTTSTNCLFCSMFKVIFNAGSYVADKAYSVFSQGLGELIILFLGVSIALIILKNIASFGAKDPGALLNDIFIKVFICVVIYNIINNDYYNIINMTITPIFETGLSLVLSGSNTCASASSGLKGYMATAGGGIGGGLPLDVGKMIICAVEDIERKITMLFEFGDWGFCLGVGPAKILKLIPNPIYLIDSGILYLGGLFFMIMYPWVMADAVLQLGIALALAPFAVAGYAFQGTKGYLGKVFSWILNSLFVFIFMGILLACVLGYIENLLMGKLAAQVDPKIIFTDANQGIAFYGPNMLKIIFTLVIGWAYMPQVKDLSESFAEGAKLSAFGAIGDTIANKAEEKAGKIADKAGTAIGKSTIAAANQTMRMGKGAVRRGTMGLVNTFGTTDAAGNKSLRMFGRTFSTEKNADGSTYLRREYTSITGRRHVMVSDSYSTIKIEYDAQGNEIKRETTFKKDYLRDKLFDKKGNINTQALQALMASPLAQDPEFRKAMMTQIAINKLKSKGKEIGTYYRSRNIIYDPANPYAIQVEQIDQTGKKTTFSLNVNMTTGQCATGFIRVRDKNRYENFAHNQKVYATRKMRKRKIKLMNKAIEKLGTNTGAGHTVNVGLATWSTGVDPTTGETLYTQERKKFLFFGKKVKKTYTADGTERVYTSNEGAKKAAKHAEKISNLQDKLVGGTPNADGGVKKKHLFYTYESHVDPRTGETYYTKKKRGLFRLGRKGKTTYYYNDRTEVVNGSGRVIKSTPVHSFGDTSETVRKDLDGNVFKTDNVTGATYSDVTFTGEYEIFFDNGMFSMSTTGLKTAGDLLGGGVVTGNEKTTFSYAKDVLEGHDSILSALDGNQVVEEDGSIASDINAADFIWGTDDIAGIDNVNGIGMSDFIVNNILAEGRRRRSNKMYTNIGGFVAHAAVP